jgi:hypothetical protein
VRRWLSSAVEVEGERALLRAAFAGDPLTWLPQPAQPLDEGGWLVTLRWNAAGRVVACRIDAARDDGPARWRHLVWDPADPAADPALPRMEGELGLVVPGSAGRGAQLLLSGTYVPPFGVLGLAADAAALHRAATSTLRDFLEDLARSLAMTTTGRTAP